MSILESIELQPNQCRENRFEATAIAWDLWVQQELESGAVPAPVFLNREPKKQPTTSSLRSRDRVYQLAKRVVDVLGALAALALFFPLFLVSAAIVKLIDGGPVFYVHTRVGLQGKTFKCYKFRSMVVDADRLQAKLKSRNSHEDSRTFKIPDDPRVTWFGRFMRRSSIDEIPQLFNVLLGDMSLVGPRPPVPHEVAQYSSHDMRRLDVLPGLTGLWQISGRSRLAFPEQLRLDLQYVDERSFWLDCKVLFLTIPAVLSADGAY